jgi:hypothetical protein
LTGIASLHPSILTLTKNNGGEVISKMPYGVEMYPRLIAGRACECPVFSVGMMIPI